MALIPPETIDLKNEPIVCPWHVFPAAVAAGPLSYPMNVIPAGRVMSYCGNEDAFVPGVNEIGSVMIVPAWAVADPTAMMAGTVEGGGIEQIMDPFIPNPGAECVEGPDSLIPLIVIGYDPAKEELMLSRA